jgi:tetratricopeptide (TPR) repeat protein
MLALWLVMWQLAAAPTPQPVVSNDVRIVRLQAWLAAVEQHEPGTADGPALVLRWWNRADLTNVYEDMYAIGVLIQNPGAVVQFSEPASSPTQPARPRRGYTANQFAAVRQIARHIKARGVSTDLLKRGALLHTDIALRLPAVPVPLAGALSATLQRTTLYLDDGRQQGLDQSVGHLELARRLLDLVRPNPERDDRPFPERDPMVRQWYRATTAVLIAKTNLDLNHFSRAVDLFRDDAEILFMAGALRDTLAGPRIQDGLRTARLPTGMSYNVGSDRDELRRAESFYRRSLAADDSNGETHLRLGRVLGLLGRPADAVTELRVGLASVRERLLRYYGELFLGRELDALGNRDQARGAYERASALYPLAQSPYIGLSELAMRAGDRRRAQSAMETVWRLSPEASGGGDPLWDYHLAAGRDGERLLSDVNAMFPVSEDAR